MARAETRAEHPIPLFYQSAMGRMARHLIARKLKPVLLSAYGENRHDLDVVALGYARPYLKYISEHYPHLVNLQTTAGEITPWPPSPRLPRRQALVDEHQLPLLDASLDLLLVIHCFESAAVPKDMADELWRVLKGQGRLVLVVPHRSSMWAGREDTPFGRGQPYSSNQIKHLLQDHGFDDIKIHQALAAPPSQSRFYPRYAPFVERLPNPMGGVLIVEAAKMIYAVRGDRAPAKKKARIKAAGQWAGVKSPRSSE